MPPSNIPFDRIPFNRIPFDRLPDAVSEIIPLNQPPTVVFTPISTTLPEDTITTSRVLIGNIEILDEGIGTNDLFLSGADADFFEIIFDETDGYQLFLKAGTALDFETKTSFDVTIDVDDAAIGAGVDDSVDVLLNITDVFEPVFLSATINFEMDLFDFESNSIVCHMNSLPDCDTENTLWDFKFAFNANFDPHAVLFQNDFTGTEIAFLDETSLVDAAGTDLTNVDFTTSVIDMSFESDDTILIMTADGNVFAIGNATETELSVSFDYFEFI